MQQGVVLLLMLLLWWTIKGCLLIFWSLILFDCENLITNLYKWNFTRRLLLNFSNLIRWCDECHLIGSGSGVGEWVWLQVGGRSRDDLLHHDDNEWIKIGRSVSRDNYFDKISLCVSIQSLPRMMMTMETENQIPLWLPYSSSSSLVKGRFERHQISSKLSPFPFQFTDPWSICVKPRHTAGGWMTNPTIPPPVQ